MGNKAGTPSSKTTRYAATATNSEDAFRGAASTSWPSKNAPRVAKSGKQMFNVAIGHPSDENRSLVGNPNRTDGRNGNLLTKKKKSVRFDASAGPLLEPEVVDDMYARGPRVKPPQKWTAEQDAALRVAVEKYGGKNWKAIAAMVPDRNHVQCLQRWKKVLKPGLIKGHWTAEEDAKLVELVKHPSLENWAMVAQHVPGRTAKQCRERWSLNLDPSINRGPWTPAEDDLLLKLQAEKGNKWAELSTHLPGRTENAVKTRYKSLMRARAREWTPAEDAKLIQARQELGRRWSAIAQLLQGRSKNAVKTRWKYLVKNDENLSRMYAGVSSGSSAAPVPLSSQKPIAGQPKALLRKTTSQVILGEVLAEFDNAHQLPTFPSSSPQPSAGVNKAMGMKTDFHSGSWRQGPAVAERPMPSTAGTRFGADKQAAQPREKSMRAMYSEAPFLTDDQLNDLQLDGLMHRESSTSSEFGLPQHRLSHMFSSTLISSPDDDSSKMELKPEKSMLRAHSSSSFNRDFALFDALDMSNLSATPDFDML